MTVTVMRHSSALEDVQYSVTSSDLAFDFAEHYLTFSDIPSASALASGLADQPGLTSQSVGGVDRFVVASWPLSERFSDLPSETFGLIEHYGIEVPGAGVDPSLRSIEQPHLGELVYLAKAVGRFSVLVTFGSTDRVDYDTAEVLFNQIVDHVAPLAESFDPTTMPAGVDPSTVKQILPEPDDPIWVQSMNCFDMNTNDAVEPTGGMHCFSDNPPTLNYLTPEQVAEVIEQVEEGQ
jgi:hypothetical protein